MLECGKSPKRVLRMPLELKAAARPSWCEGSTVEVSGGCKDRGTSKSRFRWIIEGVEEYGIISGVRRKADTSGGEGLELEAEGMSGPAGKDISSRAGGSSFCRGGVKTEDQSLGNKKVSAGTKACALCPSEAQKNARGRPPRLPGPRKFK
jgi:hypothetical protein